MNGLRRHLVETSAWLLAGCCWALWAPLPSLDAQNAKAGSPRPATANLTPSTTTSKTAGHTVRVLSYNIHHAEGVDGRLDVERVAKVILSVQPDIVALQEVDSGVKRSMNINQPRELARLTNMQFAFGANIDLEGGKYGNALLTRGAITKSQNHPLPNVDRGEQRGLLEVILSHEGQSLRVFATHFDHRRDAAERLASVEMINKLVKNSTIVPTLMIGDLNAEFSSEVLDRVRDVWSIANTEPLPTFPVARPAKQIDFIVTFPQSHWRTMEIRVLDESIASDHRAILAVLEF